MQTKTLSPKAVRQHRIMTPREYEYKVARYFEDEGFEVKVTSYGNDYGVDAIASKNDRKLAIQAKMFGGTNRRINRQMVMELHGAAAYFQCDSAVIATDGDVLENAREVAAKLDIAIIHIPAESGSVERNAPPGRTRPNEATETFETIRPSGLRLAGSTVMATT